MFTPRQLQENLHCTRLLRYLACGHIYCSTSGMEIKQVYFHSSQFLRIFAAFFRKCDMGFGIGKTFRPKFFSLFGKGRYSSSLFASDLAAGVIVGIIALPLAIAFGIV